MTYQDCLDETFKELCLNYCYEQAQLKYYSSCQSLDNEYQGELELNFLSQQSDANFFDIKIVPFVENSAYDKFIDAFNKHPVDNVTLHFSNIINLDHTCTPLYILQDKLKYILDKINYNKAFLLEFNNKKVADDFTNDEKLIEFAKNYYARHVRVFHTIYTPRKWPDPWESVDYDVTKN